MGIHAWITGNPYWPGLAAAGAAFVLGLILFVIGFGSEENWWHLDGERFDSLATVWFGITIVAAVAAGVAVHFAVR